jgi:hypothetical protein
MDVKVSYDTRWIFHQFSGMSIKVFKSSWARFTFSACNKLTRLKSVPCVILSITHLKDSATPGIVTTRIGSCGEINAGFPWGGVDWISNMRRGTEINIWSGYHFRSLLAMPGKLLCA